MVERVIDATFDRVWSLLSDFEGEFGNLQPDMRHVTILSIEDGIDAITRSDFGMRAHLRGTIAPGWCWLQSRFLIIGMTAADAGDGRTRVAHTGVIRIPGQAEILPNRRPSGSRRTLAKLAQRSTAGF